MRDLGGRNAAAARELRALAESESLHLDVCELDVTDQSSVERAVAVVTGQAGGIDVLVNNAAYGVLGLTGPGECSPSIQTAEKSNSKFSRPSVSRR
jgi:NAD(P)-dependent dehydrogenase (short-subunit alcohol dehydrogenase family)